MQIFFRISKTDFLPIGLTRPQSITKSKQISGQTILNNPQDLEFNPNFAKDSDILVVRNSVTRPVTPALLTTDTLWTFYSTLVTYQIPPYNLYYIFQYTYLIWNSHFVWIQYIVQNCPTVGLFLATSARRQRPSPTKANFKQVLRCVLCRQKA